MASHHSIHSSNAIPIPLKPWGHLAWALANKGLFEESIGICRRFLELVPASVEMRWRIGDRFVNLNRLDEAEESYRDALEVSPDCEDAKVGIEYIAFLRKEHISEYILAKQYSPRLTKLQRDNLELKKKNMCNNVCV